MEIFFGSFLGAFVGCLAIGVMGSIINIRSERLRREAIHTAMGKVAADLTSTLTTAALMSSKDEVVQ